MARPRLLVVGIGSGMERSLPTIAGLDIEVIVANHTITAVMAATSQPLIADPYNASAVTRRLREAGVPRPDGIMSLGCDNPPTIAELCAHYGCPGLDLQVARDCTEKPRRLGLIAAAGLNTPEYRYVDALADAIPAIEQLGLPVIVKPVDGTGSAGVLRIDKWDSAIQRVWEAWHAGRSPGLVIERILEGTEHTVTGFAFDGQVVCTGFSDRDYGCKWDFAPYVFESGDIVPTCLPHAWVQRVQATIEAGVRALRLEPAFFNSDVLVTPAGEVYILELTGRLTGARIATEVVPLATGFDPLPHVVRLALGNSPQLDDLQPRCGRAVVQRFVPTQGQRVRWVGDLSQVRGRHEVYDLFWGIELSAGTQLPLYRGGDCILAGVIAAADDLDTAHRRADKALAELPIVFN